MTLDTKKISFFCDEMTHWLIPAYTHQPILSCRSGQRPKHPTNRKTDDITNLSHHLCLFKGWGCSQRILYLQNVLQQRKKKQQLFCPDE